VPSDVGTRSTETALATLSDRAGTRCDTCEPLAPIKDRTCRHRIKHAIDLGYLSG
jgi:hypothetical protein